jgi:hypothetical protein
LKKNLVILEISTKEKNSLLRAIETIESEKQVYSNAGVFSWIRKLFKRRKKKSSKTSRSPELELPPNMAAGFALLMAGVLVAILPFPGAQPAGGVLCGMGLEFFFLGLVDGEKPYFIDSSVGQKIIQESK